jgi:hypothetical protein
MLQVGATGINQPTKSGRSSAAAKLIKSHVVYKKRHDSDVEMTTIDRVSLIRYNIIVIAVTDHQRN